MKKGERERRKKRRKSEQQKKRHDMSLNLSSTNEAMYKPNY
jgi:hypothetical protein